MIKSQKHREMEFRGLLVELVKLFQPEVYCEIGVKKGYTFNAIAPLVDLAIGIDPAGFTPETQGLQKLKKADVRLFPITSDTFSSAHNPDFGLVFGERKIDFLFIDGDHSAKQVEKDLINFLPFVRENTGLIFLHDTYPANPELAVKGYCHDAWKVADQIYNGNCLAPFTVLEIVTLPGPWAGLSILRKRGSYHTHWMGE